VKKGWKREKEKKHHPQVKRRGKGPFCADSQAKEVGERGEGLPGPCNDLQKKTEKKKGDSRLA